MNINPAEHVAQMVALLRKGQVVVPPSDMLQTHPGVDLAVVHAVLSTTRDMDVRSAQHDADAHMEVVDVTKVQAEVKRDTDAAPKQDDPSGRTKVLLTWDEISRGKVFSPPWETAIFAYSHHTLQRPTGGLVMLRAVDLTTNTHLTRFPGLVEQVQAGSMFKDVEWGLVRWVLNATIYFHDTGLPNLLCGPMVMWNIPVYEDGSAAACDMRAAIDYPETGLDTLIMCHALNICNAANVTLAEPHRPRPVQRRIQRSGVRVTEIHVRSIKASQQSAKGVVQDPGVPLTSVRGHFAEYGPKYGKGLLFGHIEGRFWRPQHIRGDAAYGEIEHAYVVDGE